MRRVLVAGIGNIFFTDDGFGVAVAQRLAGESLPEGAAVADFGIGGLHLAYELMSPLELLVLVDCMSCGGAPGTLYVVDPTLDGVPAVAGGHGITLPAVFATLHALGGRPPPVRLVGCEPASIDPGLGLTPAIERTIPDALQLVRRLLAQHLESP